MKDSEFIELLNLYVDHEIERRGCGAPGGGGDARSRAAARIYRQYCRMQKACMIAGRAVPREVAPAGASGSRVRTRCGRGRTGRGGCAAAGLVAAAPGLGGRRAVLRWLGDARPASRRDRAGVPARRPALAASAVAGEFQPVLRPRRLAPGPATASPR